MEIRLHPVEQGVCPARHCAADPANALSGLLLFGVTFAAANNLMFYREGCSKWVTGNHEGA